MTGSRHEGHSTAATPSPPDRPGWPQVNWGSKRFFYWKVFNWTFWESVSCMQMQMFEELFTVEFVPDRLLCQASTQPPIIQLGSASKDVSGLSESCKFPHPKAHLFFQGRVIFPLMRRHQSFPCQSPLLPALVQKRLWSYYLRGNYSISRSFSSFEKTDKG